MHRTLLAMAMLASLGGCVSEQTANPRTQALQTEAMPGGAAQAQKAQALRDECSAASTGDMYRYCLEVGPEEALRNDPAMNGQGVAALKAN
jgi:hypothetical protein